MFVLILRSLKHDTLGRWVGFGSPPIENVVIGWPDIPSLSVWELLMWRICVFMGIHTPALQNSSGTSQAPTVAVWKEELCGILNLFFSLSLSFTSPLLRFTSPTPAFDILFSLESLRGLVDYFKRINRNDWRDFYLT